MLGQSGAIAFRPQHANGALDGEIPDPLRMMDNVAVTAASTAAILTLPDGIPIGGCWVTFSTDTDCFIHFGPNASIAAASTSSEFFPANTKVNWWINDKDAYFRVIRKTADGVIQRRRSNL